MLAPMTGVTGVLVRLGASLLVFTGVFWLAARRDPRIKIENKWTTPVLGVLFAVMNVLVGWALTPLLNLATLGSLSFFMPLVVNLLFLLATIRIVQGKKWLVVDGMIALVKLAVFLTAAHFVLWVALEYFPNR